MQRILLYTQFLIVLVMVLGSAPVKALPEGSPDKAQAAPVKAQAAKTPVPAKTPAPAKAQPAVGKAQPAVGKAQTSVEKPQPAAKMLPPEAQVEGVWGYGQLLGLSCESRSAADWGRRFGITIRELAFLATIPRSDNPEVGFVGSPNGSWGNIPPMAYGVHAVPVAKALRDYGANALALRKMPFDRLRGEIAAGRPVVVWVTGHVEAGKGVPYRVDGKTITVARYEHTVIVTGYDRKNVIILDGKKVYKRPIETFLKSWSALENMAIVWDESGLNKDFERQAVRREYGQQ